MKWEISPTPVEYEPAVSRMEARVAEIHAGTADELVWLVEHPSVYTAGTSAKPDDLLNPRFPVYQTGRGGQHTYHGPGQRVAYVMMDLRKKGEIDLRHFVQQLEEWIIRTLADFGVKGDVRAGRVGVWVVNETKEHKVAALGIRVRRGISYHGIAINVNPDLSHYAGIVPCGIREHGVTSLHELGVMAKMSEVDAALQRNFAAVFEGSAS